MARPGCARGPRRAIASVAWASRARPPFRSTHAPGMALTTSALASPKETDGGLTGRPSSRDRVQLRAEPGAAVMSVRARMVSVGVGRRRRVSGCPPRQDQGWRLPQSLAECRG